MTTHTVEPKPNRVSLKPVLAGPADPITDADVAHGIEDALLAVAIAAIAMDDRIDFSLFWDIVQLLAEARAEGRADKLVAAAHQEASKLPDWDCPRCDEASPTTFDVCWNCQGSRPEADELRLSDRSRVLLGMEAVVQLEFFGAPPFALPMDEKQDVASSEVRRS